MIPLSTLQRTLQRRPASVTLSPVWQATHEELGVGTPNGRKLLLSDNDLDLLEAEYRRQTNDASLGFDLKQDRVAVSAQMTNEKASGRQVFAGYIRVASSDGALHLKGEAAPLRLPKDSYLALRDESMLDPSAYARVLIIENGAVMENLDLLLTILPPEYQHETLYLYRGHDKAQRSIFRLIAAMAPSQVLGLFFDYDVAAFSFAQRDFARRAPCPVDMLLPVDPETPALAGSNDLYLRQMPLMVRAQSRSETPAWIRRHAKQVARQQRVLIQERMLSWQMPLRAERIS